MKFIAYVTKCVPVEVEVDDKWKPMEDYGNHVDGTSEEEDIYFDENIENFLTDIGNKLKKMDKDFSFDNLCAVWTMEDNYITEL
jgi:hypothetical protein